MWPYAALFVSAPWCGAVAIIGHWGSGTGKNELPYPNAVLNGESEQKSTPRRNRSGGARKTSDSSKGISGTMGMAAVYRTAAEIEAAAAEGHLAADAIE